VRVHDVAITRDALAVWNAVAAVTIPRSGSVPRRARDDED
jgi:hypothetical protein